MPTNFTISYRDYENDATRYAYCANSIGDYFSDIPKTLEEQIHEAVNKIMDEEMDKYLDKYFKKRRIINNE